jgi:hypothetical protein
VKLKTIAVWILFLAANICSVWAAQYSFSGYGTSWGRELFGSVDKSRMCTVSFSADKSSPSGEVSAVFRFINTGNVPIKGDPFSSQKVEIVSRDGKTYEVPWYTGKVELKDGRVFEIPGKVTPEKVEHVVAHHPELQRLSSFEKLTSSTGWDENDEVQKRSVQLINPGSIVEKVFYTKDSVVCGVITSGNVDRVVFYSGMGKFILHRET